MTNKRFSPWSWVPGVYICEGGPYMIVSVVSAILFKSLGMSNEKLAFWSSLLMLPWAVKPLWTPFLDLFGSKRGWVLIMEFLMAFLFAAVALPICREDFTPLLVCGFFLLAMASATHDAAADGFYLIGLDEHGQAFFAGIRGTFYRIGSVAVQGGLVWLAGWVAARGLPPSSEISELAMRSGWRISLLLAAGIMLLLALLHAAVMPKPETKIVSGSSPWKDFFEAFASFVRRRDFGRLLLFLLLFRIAEAQLGKMAAVFLIDKPELGGLGLTLSQQGVIYGTFGVLALTLGGILGGVAVSRFGFGACLWPFVCAINLPDLVYVYLAWLPNVPLWLTTLLIAVEQFGYGIGYTAFMLVMVAAAADSGKYKTTHFAIMTGLAILGMIFAGTVSGLLQTHLGYRAFFIYVTACTTVSFLVTWPIARLIPWNFGKKEAAC